jgi:hypothetical protein
MKTEFKKVSTEQLVLDWGLAEVRRLVGHRRLDTATRVEAGTETANDRLKISEAVKQDRGRFLMHFVDFPIPWFELDSTWRRSEQSA